MGKIRRWRLRKRTRRAAFLLRKIDTEMKQMRWPKYKRKQFWRDFIKSPELRDEVFARTLQ